MISSMSNRQETNSIPSEIEIGIIKNDPFWGDDFSVLFRQDRLIEFVPSADMTTNERLNAISRFGIYTGVLLALFNNQIWPVYGSIFVLGTVLFIHKNQGKINGMGLGDLVGNLIGNSEEGFGGRQEPGFTGTTRDKIRQKRLEDLGPENSVRVNEEGDLCTGPTDDNPFMNILVPEYYEPNTNRPEACATEDTLEAEGVRDEVNDKFQINLYRDVSDLFEKNNSQRQFFTNPITTIPNKQGEFAQWLYGNAASCKDDRYDCHGDFDDPRRKRFNFPDPTRNPVTTKKQEAGLVVTDQQELSA